MGGPQFREASAGDAATLLSIKRAAIGGIDAGAYEAVQLDAWQPDAGGVSDFERAIDSDVFDILLARVDGDDVAYGVLNADAGRIDALYVRPDYSGEGIATSLVGQLESRARMYDLDRLEIVSSLNAKSFYEGLNYWQFDTKIRTIKGVEMPFAIMIKHLDTGDTGSRDDAGPRDDADSDTNPDADTQPSPESRGC